MTDDKLEDKYELEDEYEFESNYNSRKLFRQVAGFSSIGGLIAVISIEALGYNYNVDLYTASMYLLAYFLGMTTYFSLSESVIVERIEKVVRQLTEKKEELEKQLEDFEKKAHKSSSSIRRAK